MSFSWEQIQNWVQNPKDYTNGPEIFSPFRLTVWILDGSVVGYWNHQGPFIYQSELTCGKPASGQLRNSLDPMQVSLCQTKTLIFYWDFFHQKITDIQQNHKNCSILNHCFSRKLKAACSHQIWIQHKVTVSHKQDRTEANIGFSYKSTISEDPGRISFSWKQSAWLMRWSIFSGL